MMTMKQTILISAIVAMLASGSAVAQLLPPGGSIYNPPPPPPPPPPRIEVPPIPKMDALPSQPRPRSNRPSFGDRISKCLDEAAAAGLNQADRGTYSRSCAQRD